ncbi:MAG: hypothetical protein D6790_18380, partial [Caldilineae bacterium]
MTLATFLLAGLVLVGLHASRSQAAPAAGGWTPLGPEGGPVNDLAVDPTTSDTIYAATGAGVFKSTDGGGTWSGISHDNGMLAQQVHVVTV